MGAPPCSGRDGNLTGLSETGERIAARFPGAVQAYTVAAGFPFHPSLDNPLLLDPMNWLHEVLHEVYGVKEACLYLIRPDWYVGVRGGMDKTSQLAAYLGRVLGRIEPEAL